MREAVLRWLMAGEVGVSSKAMACAICDMTDDNRWAKFGDHPSDPDDLRRCVLFLEAVPGARKHMDKVAAKSDVWRRLVTHWQELETMLREEMASGTGSAPRTYARMKELGA